MAAALFSLSGEPIAAAEQPTTRNHRRPGTSPVAPPLPPPPNPSALHRQPPQQPAAPTFSFQATSRRHKLEPEPPPAKLQLPLPSPLPRTFSQHRKIMGSQEPIPRFNSVFNFLCLCLKSFLPFGLVAEVDNIVLKFVKIFNILVTYVCLKYVKITSNSWSSYANFYTYICRIILFDCT